MNSDPTSDDDSISGTNPVPVKRTRTNTFEVSSNTSHSSDSEDGGTAHTFHNVQAPPNSKIRKNTMYSEYSSGSDSAISRSRLSGTHASNEQNNVYRPDNNDADSEELSVRPSFNSVNDSAFYNKHSEPKETEDEISGQYSEKSKRMMSNMGHRPGKGLGKFEHGMVEPVSASTQKGTRGLGYEASTVGEAPKDFKWSPNSSVPDAVEKVVWMPSPPAEPPSGAILSEWLQLGPKKMSMDDETDFVDEHILRGLLDAKSIFDTLDDEDLRLSRFRCNPFETIGAVIFLNRAAVKMANIDSVFDFMFTNPKTPNGEPAIDSKNILYFADVCAGPGGFSEYVLYRKGWRAKGFGFTLKGNNDFKVSDFCAGTPETFNTFYGVKEDGDVYDPANLTSLKEFVFEQTEDQGVHFLMADGGFSVKGQENLQEILSKQLYLCQCLAALMLVRTGGHFVVKLFDVFTLFSISLIYVMYRCFEKVCVHKPVSSRPANSERYLVCKWKKPGTDPVELHLFSVNSLWSGLGPDKDVTSLVPLDVIKEDKEFFSYMYNSNCVFSEKQIEHLLKIAAFSKDKNLTEPSQPQMRAECLKLWKLPDQVRTQPERLNANETLLRILSLMKKPPTEIVQNNQWFEKALLSKPSVQLEKKSDLEVFKNVYDWHFTFLNNGKNSTNLKIFLGCGGKRVFTLESNGWRNNGSITIPAKTLFYGEIVKENTKVGLHHLYINTIHVIDALMLGGVDISHLSLTERINQCQMFCTALEKQNSVLRCKKFFNMENFSSAVRNLEYGTVKRMKRAVVVNVPVRNSQTEIKYVVGSLLFVKEVRDHWIAQISKKTGVKYYFTMTNNGDRISEYHLLEEARLDMLNAFSSRVMWPWEEAASAILEGQPQVGISRLDMEEYVTKNTVR